MRTILAPHYRRYFPKNNAISFFVEGFGMLNTYKKSSYYLGSNNYSSERLTHFAVGISAGAKFVAKNEFVAVVGQKPDKQFH